MLSKSILKLTGTMRLSDSGILISSNKGSFMSSSAVGLRSGLNVSNFCRKFRSRSLVFGSNLRTSVLDCATESRQTLRYSMAKPRLTKLLSPLYPWQNVTCLANWSRVSIIFCPFSSNSFMGESIKLLEPLKMTRLQTSFSSYSRCWLVWEYFWRILSA